MSFKSTIQFFIILLSILIVGIVYLKYFDTNKNVIEEINTLESNNLAQLEELEKKISDLEIKNKELIDEIENNNNRIEDISEKNFNQKKEAKVEKTNEMNLIKEVKSDNKKINDKKKDLQIKKKKS